MQNKLQIVLGMSIVIVLLFVGITLAYASSENVTEAACVSLGQPYLGPMDEPYPTPAPPECSYLPVIQK